MIRYFFTQSWLIVSLGFTPPLLPSTIAAPLLHETIEGSPWHFHTGRGRLLSARPSRDPEGYWIEDRPLCQLSRNHLECGEEVFYFSFEQVEQAIDQARQSLTLEAELRGGTVAAAGLTLSYTLKTTAAGLVAPEPTVSKAIAIGAGVASAGIGLWMAWEGYQLKEALQRLTELEQFIASEKQFTEDCHHIRKSFLQDLQKFDVYLQFPRYGEVIDARYYFDSLEREQALFRQTIQHAHRLDLSQKEAYRELFLESCGQLPTYHHVTEGEASFWNDWSDIPVELLERTQTLSKKLQPDHSQWIDFSQFQEEDANTAEEKIALHSFLTELEEDLNHLKVRGTRIENRILESDFLNRFHQIWIRPAWQTRVGSFRILKEDDRETLIVFAQFQLWNEGYTISLRPFFKEQLGIDFENFYGSAVTKSE